MTAVVRPALFARLAPAKAMPDLPAGGDTAGDRPSLAIAIVLAAMLTFVVMDGLCKLLTTSGMVPETIIFVRYSLVLLFLLPVVVARWRSRPLATGRPVLHLARGVALIGSATLFVYALQSLPLATATAIGFVSPLYVTALSIPFLGEKVGIRRWAAVGVGFFGVLLILRPGGATFELAMVLPLVSSFLWACGLIITRAMRGRERPLAILVWSTCGGLMVITPLGLAAWQTPTAEQWLLLVLIAGCHLLGQYLTIRAFTLASASLLAPFSYTTMIWATLIGLFVFGNLPDLPTLAGSGILAAAGLYVWHRERIVTGRPTVRRGAIAEVAAEPAPEPIPEPTPAARTP
ncbi:MAG: DMT family transporter [Alphaproteobacteria bacterium]|nr:DMT family transporter [Alphaproteobacteria bacterium]MCB9929365.1 DMT family transporter [Alphaproteobacteria bacterium]